MPIEIFNSLNELERNVYARIRELGNSFSGDVSIQDAKSKIDIASREIKFSFNQVINEYEQAFISSQELIKKSYT